MKDKTIIMFCNLRRSWLADYAMQTARILARNNRVFCYLGADPYSVWDVIFRGKPLCESGHSIRFYHPLVLPGRRWRCVHIFQEWLNVLVLQRYIHHNGISGSEHVIWVFDSMFTPLLSHMPPSWGVLYDCVDVMWDNDKERCRKLVADEKILIKKATWMTVNSHVLYALHKKDRPDAVIVPQGFRMNAFRTRQMSDRARSNRPVIGFVGVLDERVDYQLVFTLAERHPEWDFDLCGPIVTTQDGRIIEHLQHLPNIVFTPPMHGLALSRRMHSWTIAVIPYRMTPFTRHCYPMKLFEYLYIGLPVVSTPIRELTRFPDTVRIGHTASEWERHIRHWLIHPLTNIQKQTLRRMAVANSWEEKVSAIMRIVESGKKPYNGHKRI